MKKIISLILSTITLLSLTACGSHIEDEMDIKPEEINIEIDSEIENPLGDSSYKAQKQPIVKIEELPIEVKILEPDSIGTTYMEATYKNGSNYTIKGLSIAVLLKDKNEKTYLSIYKSVTPGEISSKFETFAPESGKSEDYEFLAYEITVEKDENTVVHIIYDVNTREYNWFYN